MNTDSAEISPLIDTKESAELKKGVIDRIPDEGVNTFEDLQEFVCEQQEQAIRLLKEKAKILFGIKDELTEDESRILEDSIHIILALTENLNYLSIDVVQTICSQLSDIIGFQLEIDEEYNDQFGLSYRVTGYETKQSAGFGSYSDEKIGPGAYRIEGRMQAEIRKREMQKFNTEQRDIDAVKKTLTRYGEVQYREYASSGPVLVLLPEMHYDAGSIGDNFEIIQEVAPLISVLGTEGMTGEVKADQIGEKGTEYASIYRNKIIEHQVGISTIAAEDTLGDHIYTVGTEDTSVLRYALRELEIRFERNMKDSEKRIELDEAAKRLRQAFVGGKTTKQNLMQMIDGMFDDGTREALILYRNQRWLRNLQNSMMTEREKHSSTSNIAFLVCGAAHAEDLAFQARYFGFKGVVTFQPNAFEERPDMEAVQSYLQHMFGITLDPTEPLPIIPNFSSLTRFLIKRSREDQKEFVHFQISFNKQIDRLRLYPELWRKTLKYAAGRLREPSAPEETVEPMALFHSLIQLNGSDPTHVEAFKEAVEHAVVLLAEEARKSGDKEYETDIRYFIGKNKFPNTN